MGIVRGEAVMANNDWKIDLIPLTEAVLCEDCKIISRAKHANCPSCGGAAIWNLARVIERVTQPEMDRIIEGVWQKS
jgi:RNA polymerase subunit RPABC4/transcription elongation factor Spt4